jgi:hypothetical protein
MSEWKKYNELQANSYWAAFDNATVWKLLDVIDKQINFKKTIDDQNASLQSEHDEKMKDVKLTKEEKAGIKVPKLEFKNDFEKFQYGFDKMISRWKTLLHDTDEVWNLNIKIYDVVEEHNYRLLGTYKVEVKDLGMTAKDTKA